MTVELRPVGFGAGFARDAGSGIVRRHPLVARLDAARDGLFLELRLAADVRPGIQLVRHAAELAIFTA
jgi:hypothetical protein